MKVIALIGESCVGKSTLAEALKQTLGAHVYTGKDYARLAKGEAEARAKFAALLREAAEPVVYVVSEMDQLVLLPEGCVRVLMTAALGVIRERFALRMGGKLPPPVAGMLERKHGMFDGVAHEIHLKDGAYDADEVCGRIGRTLN